ncbi:MAG: hypothetical protein ACFCUX_04415 [Candidatus Methylacidiphilales bacterium]
MKHRLLGAPTTAIDFMNVLKKGWRWALLGLLLLLLGFAMGRITLPADQSRLPRVPEVTQASGDVVEQKLQLAGQVILLKKMLGEVDGEVVLMGPVGRHPISRGRLVWDSLNMEGFLHAVHLGSVSGQWKVEVFHQDRLVTSMPVTPPDSEERIQCFFKSSQRVLAWDTFRLIQLLPDGAEEIILLGKRAD